MKRREFIAGLGAAAWPFVARAQQPTMPVVGYLYSGSPEQKFLAAFHKGLGETGYIEGRNVTLEYRWANSQADRLPDLVADLIRRRVSVIVTPGSVTATLAAKAATMTIPIVFMFGADPVEVGIVASLNRVGGNVTGITTMGAELVSKRLALMRELLPRSTRIGVLLNSNPLSAKAIEKDVETAASMTRQHAEVVNVQSSGDLDAAFARFVQMRVDALVMNPGPLFINRSAQLVTLATHHHLPAIYPFRENAEIGGLMSYGSSNADGYRQLGVYTGRILRGEKPVDLPIMRATKFEFVINLNTAKTLGIEVPASLLAIADEVIE
jgi:putative ABC transport system substrate-binding protein